MSEHSSIEWTESTWNPTRGCTKQGRECDNCYAMGIAYRFGGVGQPYEGLTRVIDGRGQWNGKVRLVPEVLLRPISWGVGRRIFVDSMSDLFHPAVPFEYIADVFAVMACTTRHTYQLLTKQPDRMLAFFEWLDQKQIEADLPRCAFEAFDFPEAIQPSRVYDAWKPSRNGGPGYDNCGPLWPLQNVHLGISAGTPESLVKYLPALKRCPAAVRFISAEPLLADLGQIDLAGISWVIAGGESGRRARPMHPAWARSIRDQCAAAGVAFLFKQWGEWGQYVNEDHYTHGGAEKHAHAWVDRETADHGECWIVDDDGLWSNWTGEPRKLADGSLHPAIAVVGRYGKKASGRLLGGAEHNGFPS